ncbi:hypothetical protein EDB19DRAFT_1914987 [Suillus lakei]|nr:hypothetical protein EDB19DRAFT_1914987 [Suillus lakei]
MPWNDCAAILLRVAELVSGKYRYKLVTATMFGQGKNAWQAEIDAAAALDFFRFGVKYVESSTHSSLLKTQQDHGTASSIVRWKDLFSQFRHPTSQQSVATFQVVRATILSLFKPAPASTYSNYLVYQILAEAGVPSSSFPGYLQKSSHRQYRTPALQHFISQAAPLYSKSYGKASPHT